MKVVTVLFASAFLVALPCCSSTAPAAPTEEQADAAPIEPPLEAAAFLDVEPLDASMLGSFAPWVNEQNSSTWFLVFPYWQPAYAIVIGRTEPKSALEPMPWSIELLIAKKSPHDAGRTPPIEDWDRIQLALDPVTGRSITAASEATVRRARYPKPDIHIDERGNRVETVTGNADGTAYYFGTWRFRGSSNQPREGFARDLARLADRLRKIVEARPEEREALVAECVAFANDLRTRAESAPW